MKGTKKTIAFRLEPEMLGLLSDRAKQLGISPGACARLLVIQSILADDSLLEELREILALQQRHERNLKTATVAILVDAGKASVEEAEGFVREKLS